MERTIIPSICKVSQDERGMDIEPLYTGHVKMRVPNYDERMEIIESCNIQIAEGEDEKAVVARVKRGGMSFIRAVAKVLPNYVTDVFIERLDDKYLFKSFEDLSYDSEMSGVITELAGKLVGKYQVGKD